MGGKGKETINGPLRLIKSLGIMDKRLEFSSVGKAPPSDKVKGNVRQYCRE